MLNLTRLTTALAAVALATSLVACSAPADPAQQGSSSTTAGKAGPSSLLTAPNPNAPLYAQLPEDVKSKGVLIIGSEVGYPPMEYFAADGTTILGFDKDLSELLAQQLGVPVQWQNSTFDGLIAQLDSGRVDLIMAGMSDTPERQQKATFVDYFQEKNVIMVPAGNPNKVTSLMDTCGKGVSAQRGTSQEEAIAVASKACTDAGKPAIELLLFDAVSDSLLQVKGGRAVASVQATQLAVVTMDQTPNVYEITGQPVAGEPILTGIAIKKDRAQLIDVVHAGFQRLVADGSYATALSAYGLENGKLDAITINGATK